MPNGELWVLGGTGRTGRGVAADLAGRGVETVLVGRDSGRLAAAGAPLGLRTVVAPTPEDTVAAIERDRPRVVVNTVGPFVTSAAPLLEACTGIGSSYVDLANDVAPVLSLLGQHEAAVAAGCTLVTGSGFGVVATESVVARLCEGEPVPAHVRVDAVPALVIEPGLLGEALAGTIVEGLPGVDGGRRYQGRRYLAGRLAPFPVGGEPQRLTTPDGDQVLTSAMPLGDLVAAHRASQAPSVLAASSELSSATAARLGLRIAMPLLAVPAVRRLTRNRLAKIQLAARPAPRSHSWGHARVEWADGRVREGWLQLSEAQAVTITLTAEVAARLLAGTGRPGAYTPVALFGPSLAESCGGTYLIDQTARGARS